MYKTLQVSKIHSTTWIRNFAVQHFTSNRVYLLPEYLNNRAIPKNMSVVRVLVLAQSPTHLFFHQLFIFDKRSYKTSCLVFPQKLPPPQRLCCLQMKPPHVIPYLSRNHPTNFTLPLSFKICCRDILGLHPAVKYDWNSFWDFHFICLDYNSENWVCWCQYFFFNLLITIIS